MRKFQLLVFFLSFVLQSVTIAQDYSVFGRITDEETGEPLAFVNIVINNGKSGGVSDIDGKYYLESLEKIADLKASYVGYNIKEIKTGGRPGRLDFSMRKTSIELNEVIILPKENPAHRIILNAVENRDSNNPARLNSYSYVAYEKLIFTSDLDSVARADTLSLDTSMLKARKFFESQYLGLVENIVQRSYQYPEKSLQKVIATKISGLKDPIFVFLLSQLQPVSFYEEIITIGSQRLVNPVSKGSTSKYFFLLKDTIYTQGTGDTTFVIYYRPFKYTNFEGLTGLLYINTDKWAIQNVIARPFHEEGQMGIKIQQMYEKIDNIHWFPVQLNTDLTFKGIELAAGKDSTQRFHIVGKGRSYLRDIEINGQSGKKKFSQVEILIDPEASSRENAFWDQYRIDSLTHREKRTYEFMDSLGKAENFDKKARNLETMLTGRIPVGVVDVELNKLFRFSQFEGGYFGLGLLTNRKLSEWFRLGAYGGFGFRDESPKYGASFSLFPWPAHEVELRTQYRYDIKESGGISLFDDHSMQMYERFRNFLVINMDYHELKQVSLSFRTLKYWKFYTALSQVQRTTGFQYQFDSGSGLNQDLTSTFNFTEVTAGLRYAYKEKFLKNARTQISLGTNYPIIYFQYGRGLKAALKGNYTYDRFDVKVTKSFYVKYLGRTSLCLNLGLVNGEVPYTELFNGNGSYRQFTIYTPNSFATMRMNEFLSDSYASLYFTHNFGKLLLRYKYFQPEIAIATNIAYGSLRNPDNHQLITFQTLDKGYFESGLLFNNLLNIGLTSMGIGGYYRYGAYSLDIWQENVSVKFSVLFPI
ncbi:MAG: DUF5686 family protein [Bacteroidales bacterium]